jgi:hypothetical protein
VESLLEEVDVSALQTSIAVRKVHNSCSDSWFVPKFLLEFADAVFRGVDVESLHGEVEVSMLRTRVAVRKGHNC